MTRKRPWTLLFFAMTAVTAVAAEVDRETLTELPHLADEVMVQWGVPGMAMAVVADGEVVFSGGFGVRELDGADRVESSTVFAIGSVTKAFTALAAEMLVDQGALELDRPVRTYLQEFELQDPYSTLHATVRDLLAHRTGLPRHDAMWYRSGLGREELMARLRYLEPSSELREKFHYSNLMYMVAGMVVGRLSGGSWEDFVARRVLDPLRMERTSFGMPTDLDNVALPHDRGENGRAIPISHYDGLAVAPASSIFSSVDDMAQWLKLILARGTFEGRALVSEERVVEMWSPQMVVPGLGMPELPLTTYGLGWFVTTYRGNLFAWHTGVVDGYYSLVGVLPQHRFGVVVLTNRSDHQAPEVVTYWLLDRMLRLPEINWNARLESRRAALTESRQRAESVREKQRENVGPRSLPLEAYSGRYLHPAYGSLVVDVADGTLRATFHGMSGPLEHFGDDIFLFTPGSNQLAREYVLRFQPGDDGHPMSLSSKMDEEVPPVVFMRLRSESTSE